MTPVTSPNSPAPHRRRTASDEVEQALLDAAAHLLTTEGPGALSVRRVAADAGVSPMGVYSRFGAKQGLVEALFLDGFDRLEAALAAVPVTGDPIADLNAGCRCYRQFALDSPAAYAVMFSRAIPEFVPSDHCKLNAAVAFNVLVEGVGRGMGAGALRPADPLEVAEGIWATIHGLVSLELAGMGNVADRAAHFEATLGALLRGLSDVGPPAPGRGRPGPPRP
jgi:AcrR family transcriptional regulator